MLRVPALTDLLLLAAGGLLACRALSAGHGGLAQAATGASLLGS
jgi:hypothetical protein